MTTTVTLANIPTSSPSDTALYFLDQTKLLFQKQVLSPDRLTLNAYYVYADGDPTTPTLVTVTRREDPSKGLIHFTVRLETVQIVTTDSVVTEQVPLAATIGLSVPGPMEDDDKVLAFVGSAFSLFFDGVTSKVPKTGIISKMNFGVINDLY